MYFKMRNLIFLNCGDKDVVPEYFALKEGQKLPLESLNIIQRKEKLRWILVFTDKFCTH